jgi:putative membrane protein
MMWGYGWDMGWMWLFMPLTLIAIVLLVWFLVRAFGGGFGRSWRDGAPGPLSGASRARQILDERFAKGELTAEQYREQVQVLNDVR